MLIVVITTSFIKVKVLLEDLTHIQNVWIRARPKYMRRRATSLSAKTSVLDIYGKMERVCRAARGITNRTLRSTER